MFIGNHGRSINVSSHSTVSCREQSNQPFWAYCFPTIYRLPWSWSHMIKSEKIKSYSKAGRKRFGKKKKKIWMWISVWPKKEEEDLDVVNIICLKDILLRSKKKIRSARRILRYLLISNKNVYIFWSSCFTDRNLFMRRRGYHFN